MRRIKASNRAVEIAGNGGDTIKVKGPGLKGVEMERREDGYWHLDWDE